MRLVAAVAGVVVLVAPGSGVADENKNPKPPADAEIARLLVGKWHGEDRTTGVDGTIHYAKDGTFVGEGTVRLTETEKVMFRAEGTWKVKDGTIRFTITKSTRPGVAPVGVEVKEVVFAIDEKSVRYRRGFGRVKVRTRVKP